MKKIKILTALLLFTFGNLHAQQETHIGDQILSKDEIIDLLKPKALTRGVRINQPQPTAELGPSIDVEIRFEYDSYVLTEYAKQQLLPFGQALQSQALSDYKFLIEGHTDAIGSEGYNQVLSVNRARSVGLHLSQIFGIDGSKLKLYGKGERELYDLNNPASPANRRVRVTTIVE